MDAFINKSIRRMFCEGIIFIEIWFFNMVTDVKFLIDKSLWVRRSNWSIPHEPFFRLALLAYTTWPIVNFWITNAISQNVSHFSVFPFMVRKFTERAALSTQHVLLRRKIISILCFYFTTRLRYRCYDEHGNVGWWYTTGYVFWSFTLAGVLGADLEVGILQQIYRTGNANSVDEAEENLQLLFRLGNCKYATIEEFMFKRCGQIERKYENLLAVLENC